MFNIDKTTMAVTLSRGDTGWVPYKFTGRVLGTNDRVLWSMRNSQGAIVKSAVYIPQDNVIWVRFENPETDGLPPGMYSYDVRVVIDPIYNDDGEIIDGAEVRTPMAPASVMLLDTVGQV